MWIRIVVAMAVAFIVPVTGPAAAEGEKASDRMLVTRTFKVPQEFFTLPDVTNPSGLRQEKPEIKVLPADPHEHPGYRRFDVREFFAALGAPISPEGEAVFFESVGTLVVRATKEDFESLTILGLDCFGPTGIQLVQVTFSLVRFSVERPIEDSDHLSYANLRRRAGESWRLLDRQMVTTRSGWAARHAAGHSNGQSAFLKVSSENGADGFQRRSKPRDFAADEHGTRLDVEAVVGPDSLSLDVELEYRHRSRTGEGEEPFEHNLTTSVSVWDGYPVILQLTQEHNAMDAAAPYQYRALVLKAQLVNLGGWNQRDLEPRESKPSP